jgi:cell volume regulation protein A
MPTEPFTTAALLVTFGTLMAVSVLVSRASERLRVPVLLLFILIGMAAGSEGIGGLWFEDYALTFRVGTVALALILFDGGLNTSMRAVREAVRPAAVLATVGVVATAAVVGGVGPRGVLGRGHAPRGDRVVDRHRGGVSRCCATADSC